MIQRRFIALVVILLVCVAACSPAHAEEDARAIRGGKHLSRVVEQALIARCGRGSKKDQTGQHCGGSKVGSGRSVDSLAPNTVQIHALQVRSVHSLPCHWGALHLTI
jgi:hypothetical protein